MTVSNAVATLVLPNSDDNARDMGIFNIAIASPIIIAPFISALIISTQGGYHTLFTVAGILATLSGIAFFPIRSVCVFTIGIGFLVGENPSGNDHTHSGSPHPELIAGIS